MELSNHRHEQYNEYYTKYTKDIKEDQWLLSHCTRSVFLKLLLLRFSILL